MNYEELALAWAERVGVSSYKVKKNQMVYCREYPTSGTYKHTVDLDCMKETIVKCDRKAHKSIRNLG